MIIYLFRLKDELYAVLTQVECVHGTRVSMTEYLRGLGATPSEISSMFLKADFQAEGIAFVPTKEASAHGRLWS